MSLIMDDMNSSSLVDPREEVKKLQELVRKLEHQNQQLLNRQLGLQQNRGSHFALQNPADPRKNYILDEVDLINVEELDLSDEDSWLYLSPKGLSPEEKSVSAYKWLRKDVEDPYNRELQMARRALVYKLDELAILSPGNHFQAHSLRNGGHAFGNGVDSRTFTRPKKKREDSLDGLEERQRTSSRGNMDCINVQEIARMQEESLRQSSPANSLKRNSVGSLSGRRLSTSSRNSTDSESQDLSQPSETISSPKPAVDEALHSSPQGSSATFGKGTETSFRSSMPNLAKGNCDRPTPVRRQVAKPRIESPSRIGTFSPRAGLSPVRGERRLAARSSTNLRSASPIRSHQKEAPAPTPPSRITRIPSPKTRSVGIPVPSRLSRPAQNSWNDGCF